ncbi:hypothetical protein MAR_015346 [Mya arenaria]|uniref:Uncharacterized protein n=1 Tax=Mya arenaria TaxID=6604 RepID=A0ABY7FK06_MYAAR|nr:hypothetical protein MAR_015346 [Mya arenaria]
MGNKKKKRKSASGQGSCNRQGKDDSTKRDKSSISLSERECVETTDVQGKRLTEALDAINKSELNATDTINELGTDFAHGLKDETHAGKKNLQDHGRQEVEKLRDRQIAIKSNITQVGNFNKIAMDTKDSDHSTESSSSSSTGGPVVSINADIVQCGDGQNIIHTNRLSGQTTGNAPERSQQQTSTVHVVVRNQPAQPQPRQALEMEKIKTFLRNVNEGHFILIADEVDFVAGIDALGLIKWTAVIDFDPKGWQTGLLSRLRKRIEESVCLDYISWQEVKVACSHQSVTWIAMMGISNQPDTIVDMVFKQWKRDVMKSLIQRINIIKQFAAQYTDLKVLVLWPNDSSKVKHFKESECTSRNISPESDFQLPTSDGTNIPDISKKEAHWLQKDLDVLYVDNKTGKEFTAPELHEEEHNFYKGGTLPWSVWYALPNGNFVIERDFKRRLVQFIKTRHFKPCKSGLIHLCHNPGSGDLLEGKEIILTKSDFPEEMQELIVKDENEIKPNMVRISHYFVAKEILNQLLPFPKKTVSSPSPNLTELAKKKLGRFAVDFIEIAGKKTNDQSSNMALIMTKTFISRNNKVGSENETLGQKRRKPRVSPILEQASTNPPYTERPNEDTIAEEHLRAALIMSKEAVDDLEEEEIPHVNKLDLMHIYHMYGSMILQKVAKKTGKFFGETPSKFVTKPKYPREWLGLPQDNIRRLFPGLRFFGLIQDRDIQEHDLEIRKGRIAFPNNKPSGGYIDLDLGPDNRCPIKVFFIPARADHQRGMVGSKNAGDRVEFVLGFSLSHGYEAFNVLPLKLVTCPNCKIDVEKISRNYEEDKKMD